MIFGSNDANKKRSFNAAAAAAITCGTLAFSSNVSAGLVTNWNFSIFSEWQNPEFSEGVDGAFLGISGNAANPTRAVRWGNVGSGPETSRLRIFGDGNSQTSAGALVTNGTAANTIRIEHRNNIIPGNSATLESVDLFTTLTLTPTAPAGPAALIPPITFNVNFLETPNNGPDPSDIFAIAAGSFVNSFQYMGIDYLTEISTNPFGLIAPLGTACEEAGASDGCVGFRTAEDATTAVQFTIAVRAVPAPATLALLGLGLLALGNRGIGTRRG